MNKLLIIDAQNDFLDIAGAALAVPGGLADVQRIARFVGENLDRLHAITLTLDSHAAVAIERPGFWQSATGSEVAPFTQICEADVLAGRFIPRNAALLPKVVRYLQELEKRGHYALMVWPVHCVVGTWGHSMPQVLTDVLAQWEVRSQEQVLRILKGLNPLTEQYSAVQAEVPVEDDLRTFKNHELVQAVTPEGAGHLFMAGEALSHCVRATALDLFAGFSREQLARCVLLTDCMSPVAGFERDVDAFLHHARGLGVLTMSAAQASEMLQA
jgi:nicotinamidase/pyrazinamidase